MKIAQVVYAINNDINKRAIANVEATRHSIDLAMLQHRSFVLNQTDPAATTTAEATVTDVSESKLSVADLKDSINKIQEGVNTLLARQAARDRAGEQGHAQGSP